MEEFYKLTSLKELTLTNFKKDSNFSLSGLENAISLNYLHFKSCDLSSYDTMKYLKSLQYLYLEDSCDDEVTNLFTAMKGVDYNNLEYLGIFGMAPVDFAKQDMSRKVTLASKISSVTDISPLEYLSDVTKNKVKYLYLNNNDIVNMDNINNFSNVAVLDVANNKLTSLETACSNMSSLIYFEGTNNSLANLNGLNSSSLTLLILSDNKLNDISNLNSSLTFLDLTNNSLLENVSKISECTKLGGLYLTGCTKMKHSDVKLFANVYNRIISIYRSIDNIFLTDLETDSEKNWYNKSLSDTDLEELINNNFLTRLRLDDNGLLGNTSFASLDQDTQKDITEKFGSENLGKDIYLRYVLSTLNNMEYLSLKNITNLENIDFVKFMPKLVQLDLDGTSVIDLSILETLTNQGELLSFASLTVSNPLTDLTKIQKTISNFWERSGAYWNVYGGSRGSGLHIWTKELFDSLNNCKNIQKLKIFGDNDGTKFSGDYSLSEMTKLEYVDFFFIRTQIELPSNLIYCDFEQSCFPVFDERKCCVYFNIW